MKIYTELSTGKWVVTEEQSSAENNNNNNKFLFIPYIKEKSSHQPILTCDSNNVTISSWSDDTGFLVTLPSINNIVYNFTLKIDSFIRTFQFIESNNFINDINFLKNNSNQIDKKFIQLNNEKNDIIKVVSTKINQLKTNIVNTLDLQSNFISEQIVAVNLAKNNLVNSKKVLNELIAQKYIEAQESQDYAKKLEDSGSLSNQGMYSIYGDRLLGAKIAKKEAEILEFIQNNLIDTLCVLPNELLTSLNHVNNNINLLKENVVNTISNQNSEILASNILNGVSLFQLTPAFGKPLGVYYYELKPNITLPEGLTVSVGYHLIGGRLGEDIRSQCPLVWIDESGNEVIRNFICTHETGGSRLVITNQNNEMFGCENQLMYTTTGKYETGTSGIFADVQSGYTPVRLKGEGFFGIYATVSIGDSYRHSELIPVCVSDKSEYQPVGGDVENLMEKINNSGEPMINSSD